MRPVVEGFSVDRSNSLANIGYAAPQEQIQTSSERQKIIQSNETREVAHPPVQIMVTRAAEESLKGPASQTVPESFGNSRPVATWKPKIPRVVGGKVVPGLSPAAHSRLSLGRITRREAERKRWNPSGPVIPEGLVKHDPLPGVSGEKQPHVRHLMHPNCG